MAYSAVLDADGGTRPFAYSVTGTLPPGLAFDASAGKITGTPTAAGTTSGLNLQATDAAGRTGTIPISFETVPAVVVTSGVPKTAVLNRPFSFQMTATGGRGTLYWSVYGGTLPAGMTIDRNTGLISGTPSALGTSRDIDIRARDEDGYFGPAALFDLTVAKG